jgi:C4-type Zn-finger protein
VIDIAPLLERLRSSGALLDCPACHRVDAGWTFVDLVPIGRVKAMTLVCNHCGFVRAHAVDRHRDPDKRELLFRE